MSSFAVIGLGKFGFHVAKGLAQQGLSVIAVDLNEDHVREVNEYVQDAIILTLPISEPSGKRESVMSM